MNKRFIFFLLLWLSCLGAQAQGSDALSQEEVLKIVQEKNPNVQLADLRIEKQKALRGAAINFDAPEVLFEAPTGTDLRPGILQTFEFPTVYARQYQAQNERYKQATAEKEVTLNQLRYRAKNLYTEMQYLREVLTAYRQQDSLLRDFVEVTNVRLNVGQISNIERLNAESQYREVQYQLGQVEAKMRSARAQMALLLGNPGDTAFQTADAFSRKALPDGLNNAQQAYSRNPLLTYYLLNKNVQRYEWKAERNRFIPNLAIGFLNQGNVISETPAINQLRFGFTVPLWMWSNIARIKAAKAEVKSAEQLIVLNNYELQGQYNQAVSELNQYLAALNYYETTGLPQAQQIADAASEGYRLGSIGYYNYLINLQQVIKIRLGYLEALKNYNLSVHNIQYLKGE